MISLLLSLRTRFLIVGLIVASFVGLVPLSAVAQSAKSGSVSQLGVDVVSLKSGKSVRGAIIRQEPNGSVTLAVPREWLQKSNPELLTKLSEEEAAVQSVFVVRVDAGFPEKAQWETVWSHRETADATKVRAETEARIANDPQVKQALDKVKSLGLGAEDQVQQAIRFGAATMAAQQTADSRFFEFRDRYVKHLDGPPLWWTK